MDAGTIAKGTKTVWIGCKLPNGITLHLDAPDKDQNGKTVMKLTEGSERTFKGANSSGLIGGYGMTEVESDWWDTWLKDNAKFPALRNGVIFAQPNRDRAASNAMDHATAQTGLEAIPPDKPTEHPAVKRAGIKPPKGEIGGIAPVPAKELAEARGGMPQ